MLNLMKSPALKVMHLKASIRSRPVWGKNVVKEKAEIEERDRIRAAAARR